MTDNNDPFAAFGSDRTVIKPSAGQRRRAPARRRRQAGAGRGGRGGRAPMRRARRRSRWTR